MPAKPSGKKKKPGLWENVNKRRAEGKPKKKPGEKGYPSEKAIKESKG